MRNKIMPLTDPADLQSLLSEAKTIAVEIASPKEERTSNQVLRFLLSQGYDVYPVNPGFAGQKIADRKVFGSLEDIPVSIDIVDVFRKPEAVEPIVERAITAGAKAVWMQLEIVNEEAARKAEAAGLQVVMDRCTAIEVKRMRGMV